MALTPKQKIFADEYLIDLNATRAYKVAYPSCKKDEAAAVNGSKLLRNTKVAEYIQERMKDREKRTEITQDWVAGGAAEDCQCKRHRFCTCCAGAGYPEQLLCGGSRYRSDADKGCGSNNPD